MYKASYDYHYYLPILIILYHMKKYILIFWHLGPIHVLRSFPKLDVNYTCSFIKM